MPLIAVLLAALCTPASPSWVNAQPVASWNASPTATGYTVYWSEDAIPGPGTTPWQACPEIPAPSCYSDPNANPYCVGVDIGYAIQRCVPREGQTVYVAVTARNQYGESPKSTTVTVCMPSTCSLSSTAPCP